VDSPLRRLLLGICLALASAFFYAVAAAIAKRLKDLPAHLIVLIQMVVGVLVLAPFVDFGRVDTVEGAWTYLIIIGVVHTGLMSTLLYSAIQKIPGAGWRTVVHLSDRRHPGRLGCLRPSAQRPASNWRECDPAGRCGHELRLVTGTRGKSGSGLGAGAMSHH
jgi:hypothetical protein